MKATFELLDNDISIGKSENGYFITLNCDSNFIKEYFNDSKFIKGYSNIKHDYVYLHKNGNIDIVCGGENFFNSFEDAASFISNLKKSLQPKYIMVQLNESTTAKVYKDKIEINNQTFPVSIIDELYKAQSEL